MELLLYFAAMLGLRWLFNETKAKPPTQRTSEEIERARQNQARQEEEARRYQQQLEQERAQWRSKYSAYLKSPQWRRARNRVLREADYTCAICGGHASHVHHRKYPRGHKVGEFKRENYDYLVPLCARCHMNTHDL
jgi:5-methylcytosine-specific restriction endonuclease McrA